VTPGQAQFVVETPAAVTTVWGTTFGLDSDESFTEVVLAEGRVSVVSRRDSRHPVVLSPGEMTRVVGAREPTPPVRVNITDALSYTKLFVFRNEKTFMIADKLTEHFGVPISVHPDLAQEAVTGEFERDWSLEYILQTVARSLDGRLSGSENQGYQLTPLESSEP
jgi:ferric-dicitrate binding protein FerR (iron transport regulator)